VEEEDDEGRKL